MYELVRQTFWGSLIAVYLFLGGLGSMAFVTSYLTWRRKGRREIVAAGSLIGIVSVIVGILALILDLEHPGRFYLVLTSPRLNFGSWIVIGSLLLTLFTIFAILFAVPLLSEGPLGFLKPLTSKWSGDAAMNLLGGLASVAGVGVAIYTGILIGVVEAVPFWHTPALPLLFLVSAASTGLAVYDVILAPWLLARSKFSREDREIAESLHKMTLLDGYVILFEMVVLFTYLLVESYGPAGASASVSLLISGELAPIFLAGVVIVGLVVPGAVILGYLRRPHEVEKSKLYTALLLGLMVLIGGLALRYCVLSAGFLQVPTL